ncbi:MAG: glycoside hydrolase family 16 protein [Polyangiaceae bacterium]|nr:glycoside hydrolase family 16 protein [Polyangiaceae bacterium]
MNPTDVRSSRSGLVLLLLFGAALACSSESTGHAGSGGTGSQGAVGSVAATGGAVTVSGGAGIQGATGGANDTGALDRTTATGGADAAGGSPPTEAASGNTSGGSGATAAIGAGGVAGGTDAMGTGGTGTAAAGSHTTGGLGEVIATGGVDAATGGTSEQGTGDGGGFSDGASSTGGSSSSAGAAGEATSPSQNGGFVLAWQDDFDTLDTSLWELQTFSWDGNLAQFSTANATVANGLVTIHLTAEPTDSDKPYRGVEMRSTKTITYGKVEARIRFAKGSGVVSGLVTIYTPWPADDWNEIDFEHLGKSTTSIQTNCQVYTGPATQQPVTTSVTPTTFEQIADLGFNAEDDFHVYSAEWTPEDVKFIVDGRVVRTWSEEIARMKLPQNILFTIWASDSPSWAGAVDAATAPTSAEMDWIKVYEYR